MQKFSISTLFWLVSFVAVILAVLLTQRNLRTKTTALADAQKRISEYEDQLGELDIIDPTNCYIRHFKDEYSSDIEFRWRIHVPEIAKCQVFYATGKLPRDGLPQNRSNLIPGGGHRGAAEFVLVVENREILGKQPDNFRIGLFTVLADGTSQANQRTTMQCGEWMPWFRDEKCKYENPPFDQTTVFDLDEPFVIMKHYLEDRDGTKTGYIVWLERQKD